MRKKEKCSKKDEFHDMRMKFLKEEHEAKMKVLNIEFEIAKEKLEQNRSENESVLKNLEILCKKYSSIV